MRSKAIAGVMVLVFIGFAFNGIINTIYDTLQSFQDNRIPIEQQSLLAY